MIFTTKQTGDKGEAYAAKYLKKHKYKIIARNYKKPYGEIDIIWANGDRYFIVSSNDYDTALAVAESMKLVQKK